MKFNTEFFGEGRAVLQRELDQIELAATGTSLVATEFRGVIDESAMARAWEVLCANNPVLRAQVRDDKGTHVLYASMNNLPEFLVREGGKDRLHLEIYSTFRIENAVVELVLIRSDGGGFLCLKFDHSIADGAAIVEFFRELWSAYTDFHAGIDVVPHQKGALPIPPTELFRERWGEIELAQQGTNPNSVKDAEMFPLEVRRIVLSRAQTASLRGSARRANVSMHGVLCGAILSSLRRNGPGSGSTLMICDSNVDLRNRVDPPVGPTETTNFFTQHKAKVHVKRMDDAIRIGREIKSQLNASIKRRDLPLYQGQGDRFIKIESELPAHLTFAHVSNRGSVDSFQTPPNLELTDLTVEFPNRSPLDYSGYASCTVGGQLSIHCVYPLKGFSLADVESIVNDIEEGLLRVANI